MPSAVEQLFGFFLKIDAISDPLLDQSLLKIDADFQTLLGATTDSFSRVERDVRSDFNVIGGALSNAGGDIYKIEVGLGVVDAFLIAASGDGGGAGRVADIFSGQGGGSGRVADIFSGQGGGSGRGAFDAILAPGSEHHG